MAELLAGILNTGVLDDLLQTTKDALANLRADQLEELAQRAESLAEGPIAGSQADCAAPGSSTQLRTTTLNHQRLGNLLRATRSNLQVMRKLSGSNAGEEVNSRWER